MTFALKFTGLQAKDQYTPPFTSFLKNNHYYVKHFFFWQAQIYERYSKNIDNLIGL